MIIGIDKGHTIRGVGTGAVGIKSETGLNRPLGDKIINKFRQQGHTVIDCTVDEGVNSLSKICANANKQYLDLFISLHFNCGGGYGTEVLVYDNKGKANDYAQKVLNEICKLGYRNRGVKIRPDLYVLNSTNAQAILVECCFIDSAEDMNRYDLDKMADAIVVGITGQYPIEEKSTYYRIVTGGFNTLEGLSTAINTYFKGINIYIKQDSNNNYYIETGDFNSREEANNYIQKFSQDKYYYEIKPVQY